MAERSPQSDAGAGMNVLARDWWAGAGGEAFVQALSEHLDEDDAMTVIAAVQVVFVPREVHRGAVHALTELVHLDESAAYSVALSLRHTNASELDLRASDLLERLVEGEHHG
jgi:hypothetical protein